MSNLTTIIEAVLYLKGQPLSISALSEYVGCSSKEARDALSDLISDYAHRQTALEVVETSNGYCLQLRPEFDNLLTNLVPAELGTGALRTLAAIALKSPILQTDLIALRGSTAYQQVQKLVDNGFIRKRRQEDGRSYWLEVTEKFHQYFEIDQLDEILQE